MPSQEKLTDDGSRSEASSDAVTAVSGDSQNSASHNYHTGSDGEEEEEEEEEGEEGEKSSGGGEEADDAQPEKKEVEEEASSSSSSDNNFIIPSTIYGDILEQDQRCFGVDSHSPPSASAFLKFVLCFIFLKHYSLFLNR